jgi:iron complex outermembrane receptor protein
MADASATYGASTRSGANLVVSAEFRDRGPTNRAYPDRRPQYFTGDARNDNPPVVSNAEGDGETRDIGVLFKTSVPLARELELYALANGLDRNGLTASSSFRSAKDDRTVRALHPDGMLPMIETIGRDYSALAGVRGTIDKWKWDLSSVLGGNAVRYLLHDTDNPTLGNASPTDFYAGRIESRQLTTNLDVTRSFMVSSAVSLNAALGAEVRYDHYGIAAGQPESYIDGGVHVLDGPSAGALAPIGAQGFFGFRPVDEVSAGRSNIAAYAEAESNIRKKVLLDVAGRLERYSDYGSTSDVKVAARFAPVRGLSIRGAAGTGFRAPSLAQSYFSTTRSSRRTVNGVTTLVTARTLPVGSEEARILGAKPLEPETSVNFSAGVVMDIARYPVVTIDYYAIDIDDRIVQTSELSDTSIARMFAENGQRDIVAARYFSNAVDTRTRGVDVVGTYGLSVGNSGIVRIVAGYNSTRTRVTRVAKAPPQISRFQSLLFGRTERGKMEGGQPHHTLTTTINYSVNRLGLNLHNQRFGQVSLLDVVSPEDDQVVTAKWITDAAISYRVGRRLTIAASVNNLFDVYPDEWSDFKDGVNATGQSIFGIFRYPGGISPFGMNGRTVYLHLYLR